MAISAFLGKQLFITPSRWLFYSFFQPLKFRQEIEAESYRVRLSRMGRLALPIFIYTYPPAFLIRFILAIFCPDVYSAYLHPPKYFYISHLPQFLFNATWASLLAIVAAIIVGTIFRLSYGITGGIAASFWGVVAVRTYIDAPDYLGVAVAVVVVVGLVFGIVIGSARDIAKRSGVGTGVGSIIGLALGAPWGFPIGIGVAYVVGVHIFYPLLHLRGDVLSSAVSALLSAAVGALVAGIITGIVRGSLRARILDSGIDRALAVGTAMCIVTSATVGGVMGTAYGWQGDLGWSTGLNAYILPNISVIPVFILCYTLGYYRLPLYAFSGTSSLLALLASRRKPTHAFEYLQRSALYWDEGVFLPLPGLREMLSYTAESNMEKALEAVSFIIAQRPSQIVEARPVIREITLSDLEARSTIELIAQAFEYQTKMIPSEALLVDPRWQLSLIRFEDASREAARYCAPLGRIARRDALDQMLYNLRQVKIGQLGDMKLELRLLAVADQWLGVVQDELNKLKLSAEKVGNIDNPYICGPALRGNTRQFVGRRDLVEQIERALSKGIYRPCFFLSGERRMGKTSALNQLPRMLGSRYLPITFDLQLRGISANVAAFLAEIAESIYTVICSRGISIPKLGYYELNEIRRENEAAVYRHFDTWLKQVDAELEKEDRTILIAFDEFEKLEEATGQEFLNLALLLDWFRSVMQNRSRLAFLFCGVKTLAEMRGNWSGYFVNIQTLKVSFLAPADAFRLITQPINDYPSEQIFGKGVVEEVMRVTGNHPFLLQAVCSEVIEILNDERREQARVGDVEQAVKKVFEYWQDTYFMDLWKRTSAKQRICLRSLETLGKASLQQVIDQSNLDEQTVQETLQTLCRRDLIIFAEGMYQITSPIFCEWAVRCSRLLGVSVNEKSEL